DGICFAIIEGDSDDPRNDKLVAKEIAGTPYTTPEPTGREWKLNEVRLLAPTLPTKVVALGRNYADHVAEVFKESAESLPPTIFIKPSTAVIGPEADRKSTRLNSSHVSISYAVFCLKKKTDNNTHT